MASKRKRRRKPKDEYTFLAIRVEHYDVRVEASINDDALAPQHAWRLDDDDPVRQFVTELTVTGTATFPEVRAGDVYELTIYGDDAPSHEINLTLKDVQVKGEYGTPQYREYRGRTIPVYDPPKGVGIIDKVRGEPRWTSLGFYVAPRLVTDMLVLLAQQRQVYLDIHEHRDNRARWIRSLSLQTTDPAED